MRSRPLGWKGEGGRRRQGYNYRIEGQPIRTHYMNALFNSLQISCSKVHLCISDSSCSWLQQQQRQHQRRRPQEPPPPPTPTRTRTPPPSVSLARAAVDADAACAACAVMASERSAYSAPMSALAPRSHCRELTQSAFLSRPYRLLKCICYVQYGIGRSVWFFSCSSPGGRTVETFEP